MNETNLEFRESNSQWPGQALIISVKQHLYHQKSAFQDIRVFESTHHGMVLTLDDVIQVTERDEFAYQECIAHIPMHVHPCPRSVLVIGGGDGGVLRELTKHASVEKVTLCEIDADVISVSKKYLKSLACGFDHPKVRVHVGDGVDFLKDKVGEYDVIITDSSDPEGPAKFLFEKGYYGLVSRALKEGGVVCCQGECMWLHLDLMKRVKGELESVFGCVEYCAASVPTYPSGSIGFFVACHEKRNLRKARVCEIDGLRYYDQEVHEAAFCIPKFVKDAFKEDSDK